MKNRLIWWLVAAVAIAGIVWIVATKRGAEPSGPVTEAPGPSSNVTLSGEITLGAILPLTGSSAPFGAALRSAMDLAVEEINAGNGVDGKTVHVAVEDGGCTAEAGAIAGQKLMADPELRIILGGACDEETAGFIGQADGKEIVVLSPTATAPSLSAGGDDVFFRFAPSEALAAKAAATYAKTSLGAARAAVLSDTSEDAQALRRAFSEAFKKEGGLVVWDDTLAAEHAAAAQAQRVGAARIDVIYLATERLTSGVTFLEALKDGGVSVPVLTSGALADAQVIKDHAETFEGLAFFTPHFDETTDRARRFSDKYRTRYGETPAQPSAMAAMYSLVFLAKDLVEADGDDGAAMQRTLSSLSDWAGGALADVTLDQNGDIIWKRYAVMRAEGGTVARKEILSLE